MRSTVEVLDQCILFMRQKRRGDKSELHTGWCPAYGNSGSTSYQNSKVKRIIFRFELEIPLTYFAIFYVAKGISTGYSTISNRVGC